MNALTGVALTPLGFAADDSAKLSIRRASAPLVIRGDLSDPGWKTATRIDTWYETNPGDNLPPKVKSVGYLTYDDRYLYAGFDFEDPDPGQIRAPYADRDNVPSYTDYGGIIIDTRNDGKTGLLLLANPRGIQYDAVSDDTTGNEDPSLDLHWDSAAQINSKGWTLEIRVPFSSLRYTNADPQSWGILLYRNYPRDYRYQLFTNTLPRGGLCFVCRCNRLLGLEGLPSGRHFVIAPYFTAAVNGAPANGLGTEFVGGPLLGHLGADAKWVPSVDHALDATLKPDFSQVESDVALVGANQRFALYYPEKRPFFLEGLELFATPIQAVYTRTITSPDWGVRATGKFGATAYTALVAQDAGGGTVVLPGPISSSTANQDFRSLVGVTRIRRDIGSSFVSLLVTDREIQEGGYNRLFGPDFQWRQGAKDVVTGQLLLSRTQTPNRPDLSADWTGQRLSSYGTQVAWNHSTKTLDWTVQSKSFGDGFRADDGYVPQVGYWDNFSEVGYTVHPSGLVSRFRAFVNVDRSVDTSGGILNRAVQVGANMDGKWSSFLQLRFESADVKAFDRVLPRKQLLYTLQASLSRFSAFTVDGHIGQDLDFVNGRTGRGGRVTLTAVLRPSDHVELKLNEERDWLFVNLPGGTEPRLFRADVARLKATYTLTSRMFIRAIAQWVETLSDPTLYIRMVPDRRTGSLTSSALFSYKVNWQTVLFVGYGDDRTLTDTALERADNQFFLKVSYAFQR